MDTVSIASRKLYLDNSPIIASLRSYTLFALGVYGKILLYGEHVLKVPCNDDPQFRDDCYKDLIYKKDIYVHLGHSEYVVDWFENNKGIEMARIERGSIKDYIWLHGRPLLGNLKKMIQQLVCTYCYIYNKNVILYDLFPRNILVDCGNNSKDDISLKLCDFGNSIKLPVDLDISKLIVDSISAQVDIFNLGYVIYSLVKWEVHSYNLFG
jgi:serine/threonine protein kinase